MVPATNKICGAISVTSFCLFCVVKQPALKITLQHNVKENLCHFSTSNPAFFWYISCLETDIFASSDSVSHLIQGRIKGGGQLPRAPRCKGAPRDEIY